MNDSVARMIKIMKDLEKANADNYIMHDLIKKGFKIYHPTEEYNKGISTAKFYGGKKYNYPMTVHDYKNQIDNRDSNSKKKIKYSFKNTGFIADFVWTFSMGGEKVSSYYLQSTNDHYLLWETNQSEMESIASYYDLKVDEDDDLNYTPPIFYELKRVCKNNILRKKDAARLLLYDYWKDNLHLHDPDESSFLGDILSRKEISSIFQHITRSRPKKEPTTKW